MIKFCEMLKELRQLKKLSQKELANILQVDQRTISNWETGARRPDFEMLEKMSVFFDVTIGYLLGAEEYR